MSWHICLQPIFVSNKHRCRCADTSEPVYSRRLNVSHHFPRNMVDARWQVELIFHSIISLIDLPTEQWILITCTQFIPVSYTLDMSQIVKKNAVAFSEGPGSSFRLAGPLIATLFWHLGVWISTLSVSRIYSHVWCSWINKHVFVQYIYIYIHAHTYTNENDDNRMYICIWQHISVHLQIKTKKDFQKT